MSITAPMWLSSLMLCAESVLLARTHLDHPLRRGKALWLPFLDSMFSTRPCDRGQRSPHRHRDVSERAALPAKRMDLRQRLVVKAARPSPRSALGLDPVAGGGDSFVDCQSL